jgi:hypothetical protein
MAFVNTSSAPLAMPVFELRFPSLFDPGRGLAFPCDCGGQVDLDRLSPRARSNYLFARAMVGREFACPAVQPHTDD